MSKNVTFRMIIDSAAFPSATRLPAVKFANRPLRVQQFEAAARSAFDQDARDFVADALRKRFA